MRLPFPAAKLTVRPLHHGSCRRDGMSCWYRHYGQSSLVAHVTCGADIPGSQPLPPRPCLHRPDCRRRLLPRPGRYGRDPAVIKKLHLIFLYSSISIVTPLHVYPQHMPLAIFQPWKDKCEKTEETSDIRRMEMRLEYMNVEDTQSNQPADDTHGSSHCPYHSAPPNPHHSL